MDQIKIGKFIAKVRKENNMTQRELADALMISDKTVSKWECGKGLPEVSLMMPLCEILTISVNEFSVFISDPEVTVVDVRTAEEHAQDYIPGTDFNIDVLEDGYEAEAIAKLPKDKPVALYCRSGNRSKKAARILVENGYEVMELGSGFNGWASSGRDIER